ncbi:YggS family pyridoxal phosphate enzyme, partial [Nitrospinae bacterium AH_259_B05_G02_I21]|nr:YggS family pyridoxal phosphate enzyme [Nitrospinae bacterium AH_259_B05_G02_I21]
PEENRGHFQALRLLRGEIAQAGIEGVEMTHLSMGMSGDFEVAVEEGATLVRVGTAIFGPREVHR